MYPDLPDKRLNAEVRSARRNFEELELILDDFSDALDFLENKIDPILSSEDSSEAPIAQVAPASHFAGCVQRLRHRIHRLNGIIERIDV